MNNKIKVNSIPKSATNIVTDFNNKIKVKMPVIAKINNPNTLPDTTAGKIATLDTTAGKIATLDTTAGKIATIDETELVDISQNPQNPQSPQSPQNPQNPQKKLKIICKLNEFDVNFICKLKECGLNEDIANEFNIALNNNFLENCRYNNNDLCLYKTIIYNNMKNNKTIIENYLNTNRNYYTVANMTYSELNPDLFKDVIEHNKKVKEIINTKTICTIIQCTKCKKYSTTYYFKQARSMDEGMTCFITCNFCGKEWRE